jgi:hypothetical protein
MGGEFFLFDTRTGGFVQRRSDSKALYACTGEVAGSVVNFSPTCVEATVVFQTRCTGRVKQVTIEGGSELRFYDRMGNVNKR